MRRLAKTPGSRPNPFQGGSPHSGHPERSARSLIAVAESRADPKNRDLLEQSKKEGLRNKIEDAPSFFIDGRRYDYDLDLSVIVEALNEVYERSAKGGAAAGRWCSPDRRVRLPGQRRGRGAPRPGDRVTGIRRSNAAAAELSAVGIAPLLLDLAAPGAAECIPADVDAILACQSARGDGAATYREAYVDANRALLSAASARGVKALVFTSSTGVFGQSDGGDVDEDSPPAPAPSPPRSRPTARPLRRAASSECSPSADSVVSGTVAPKN